MEVLPALQHLLDRDHGAEAAAATVAAAAAPAAAKQQHLEASGMELQQGTRSVSSDAGTSRRRSATATAAANAAAAAAAFTFVVAATAAVAASLVAAGACDPHVLPFKPLLAVPYPKGLGFRVCCSQLQARSVCMRERHRKKTGEETEETAAQQQQQQQQEHPAS